jgi:hypothetical protein
MSVYVLFCPKHREHTTILSQFLCDINIFPQIRIYPRFRSFARPWVYPLQTMPRLSTDLSTDQHVKKLWQFWPIKTGQKAIFRKTCFFHLFSLVAIVCEKSVSIRCMKFRLCCSLSIFNTLIFHGWSLTLPPCRKRLRHWAEFDQELGVWMVFFRENPSINGWELGVALWFRKPYDFGATDCL